MLAPPFASTNVSRNLCTVTAAYDVAGGPVIASYRRHHQKFLRFLKVINAAVPKDLDLHPSVSRRTAPRSSSRPRQASRSTAVRTKGSDPTLPDTGTSSGTPAAAHRRGLPSVTDAPTPQSRQSHPIAE